MSWSSLSRLATREVLWAGNRSEMRRTTMPTSLLHAERAGWALERCARND